MIRIIDFTASFFGLIILSPILLLVLIAGFFDTGSPLFIQERLGRNKKPFKLVKFRTMKKNTSSVASHLVSSDAITPMGGFLRKTKLDELPQLWNVLKGEMSLVGPRPNLANQSDLITARDNLGIYQFRPGITGLAQINNIDMSTPELLAETDQKMMTSLSLSSYFRFIIATALGGGSGDAVK